MFTLNDILQANDGTIHLNGASINPEQVFSAAHHDSRQIGQGDLFIAIKDSSIDGHTFIPAVAKAGAGAVLGRCRGRHLPRVPEQRPARVRPAGEDADPGADRGSQETPGRSQLG